MKRSQIPLLCLLAAACLLSSCNVNALQPWFTKDIQVFEPSLLGTWVEAGNEGHKTTLVFEKAKDSSYDIRVTEDSDNKETKYSGHLGKLGGSYYLDYRSSDSAQADLYIPVHCVMQFTLGSDELKIRTPDDNAWEEAAKADHLKGLGVAWTEDKDLVLTAPSADLQAFLLHIEKDSPLWGEVTTFARKK
jgi:hypothetical protein